MVNPTALVATTAKLREKQVVNAVNSEITLMMMLKNNKKIKTGNFRGSELAIPLSYKGLDDVDDASLGDVGFIKNYATFSPTLGAETITHSKWEGAELVGHITMSYREQWQNSGSEAVIDWAEHKLENLEQTMLEVAANSLYGDGTGWSNNEWTGLGALLPEDPTTGTVGGINRADDAWFRHKANATGEITKDNIRDILDEAELECNRGTQTLDCKIFGKNIFRALQQEMHEKQRIMVTDAKPDTGLKYIYDSGSKVYYDAVCPANEGYMWAKRALEFRYPKGWFFKVGDKDQAEASTYEIINMYAAGNLVLIDPARCFRLTNTPP